MPKKNQSFTVDASTAQILHSLAHSEPLDSIECNISQALGNSQQHSPSNTPSTPSASPMQLATKDDEITPEEYYTIMDSLLSPLEKIFAKLRKVEENKLQFKQCLHDLKNGADFTINLRK